MEPGKGPLWSIVGPHGGFRIFFGGPNKDVLGFRVASLFQGLPEKEVLQVWETPHIELHPSLGGGGGGNHLSAHKVSPKP